MADTVILTMPEFGRAVQENGSQVCGKWPGLSVNDRLEGRDLAVTTDFRDVL